jgi:hypothetical protein
MGTLVDGMIGLTLLAILFTAGLRLIQRRHVRRLSFEGPADRYQREIREIRRITRARSEHRYTHQVGDPPMGNYGSGWGA